MIGTMEIRRSIEGLVKRGTTESLLRATAWMRVLASMSDEGWQTIRSYEEWQLGPTLVEVRAFMNSGVIVAYAGGRGYFTSGFVKKGESCSSIAVT